jgi:hypothetical protein
MYAKCCKKYALEFQEKYGDNPAGFKVLAAVTFFS